MTKFRTNALVVVATLGFALIVVSGSASALDSNSGSPAAKAACEPEAWKFCTSVFPNADKVTQCLKTTPGVSKLCKDYINGVRH
ncbi:MAG: hypothetical protein P4L53_05370 [Candidatus Obscuribacterales bacterium]|nr:hypothetical protein [Candidatus Obscuribacterales bacterium]